MELTILGTSGAWPAAGRAANGLLLRHEGFNLVIDFGTGTLANLQRHLRHEAINAIFVSHEHWDHCIDLYPLFIARYFHLERLPPLPLLSPPGLSDRLARMEDEDGAAEMRRSLEFREVEPGAGFELGPFRARTWLLPHWVRNLGVRLETDAGILVYTGDTGPSKEIEEMARDADVLVAESSWLDGQEKGRDPFHLTARQAGLHAARAGVRNLVLTHFWPTNDREQCREQAGDVFDGIVTLAEEGMGIDVAG